MMVKYKYQDGRTPENAVAFLNECALKFTSPRIGGESVELLGTVDLTNEYGDKNFAKYVHFRLLDGYLYVTIVSKWKYSFDKKEFTAILNNDVIDLHIGQAANVMNTPLKCYVNHRVYRLHKNNDIPKEDSMLPKKVLIKNTENFQYTYHWQYKNEERVGTHNIAPVNLRYLVLNLFDQSLQFHNEHYEERILEAFNFLLNYYPAQPGNDAPKEETNKPLGF